MGTRGVLGAVCLLLTCGSAAVAQTPFLPRAAFYLQWGSFITSDPRFSWDGAMGLDIDLAEYPGGRLNFSADYEAILGSEIRAFELNHENFSLDASGSYQVRSVALAAAFHHVSRHLSDRPNPHIIAWNVLDARAARRFAIGRSVVDAELALGHVLQRTFVDYDWTSDLRVAVHRPIDGRWTLFASGVGHLVGVDTAKLGRDRQCGARLEAGLHVAGQVAALEFFAGYERRIDGYPTERTRLRAFTFGFRLRSR